MLHFACRFLALAIASGLLCSVQATVGASPAAACPGIALYEFDVLKRVVYKPTRMHSDWGNGGQTITVTKGSTATNARRTVDTLEGEFNIGVEYGPIKAGFNAKATTTEEITTSSTITLDTSYEVLVPNGKSAREMRWALKKRIWVHKYRYDSSCRRVTIYKAVILAPRRDRFVWDYQDRHTKLPGCKVRGYPSYGRC